MEQAAAGNRNYSSISPSAKALLLMKGLTEIPYARRAAELISLPEPYVPDYSNRELPFWARVTHFENRYQSIDQLLKDLPVNNILELSSGFSFRGLDAVQQRDVHYIDTDLPQLIEQKLTLISELQAGSSAPKGKLEILPLNALDEAQFHATINRFSDGALAIVNEGLLMYLGIEEKKKLCALIREALSRHGGYWITADIYIRNEKLQPTIKFDDELQHFLDEHHVEDNKFASIEEAEALFHAAGFVVDREAEPDYEQMSSLPYLMQSANKEQLAGMNRIGKVQTTWRLKLA